MPGVDRRSPYFRQRGLFVPRAGSPDLHVERLARA
jgi:hypothetical protein